MPNQEATRPLDKVENTNIQTDSASGARQEAMKGFEQNFGDVKNAMMPKVDSGLPNLQIEGLDNKANGDSSSYELMSQKTTTISNPDQFLKELGGGLKGAAEANGGSFSRKDIDSLSTMMKDNFGLDVTGGERAAVLRKEGHELGLRFRSDSKGDFSVVNRDGETQSGIKPADVIRDWQTPKASTESGGKPEIESSPKDGDASQTDASKQSPDKGVVQIRTHFGGTSRVEKGSGFNIAKDGSANETIDGERLIGTAAHVVSPGEGDVYRATYKFLGGGQQGPELFHRADKDGNNELSKDEVSKRSAEPAPDSKPSGIAEKQERQFQADHILKNFDAIKALDPAAKDGITVKALEAYYRQNVSFEIQAQNGTFKGEVAAQDKQADSAVLRVKNLDPQQEKSFGPDIPLANTEAKVGDKIVSLGYTGGQFQVRPGNVTDVRAEGRAEVPLVRSGDARIIGGMSGGPVLNANGEVVAHNHGGNAAGTKSDFVPNQHIKRLLKGV